MRLLYAEVIAVGSKYKASSCDQHSIHVKVRVSNPRIVACLKLEMF